MLARLLKIGVSAIITDFGERVYRDADYYGMPAAKLHNLCALLYQRAALEATEFTAGEGIIWARAGSVGCQRYPIHWGGDAACSWDGLTGSIRGGLHLGLSGFAFWSGDVTGFHGVPDSMNSWLSDDLYVRWTQVGVFSSHPRYRGTSPGEPYEYPAIADIVPKWPTLCYALIPYLAEQGERSCATGLLVLTALIFHHGDDPTCWNVDDEYNLGDALLATPSMNSEGVRDVYLPEGQRVGFWSGASLLVRGGSRRSSCPRERMTICVRAGAAIPVYLDAVQCTDEIG